MVKLAIAQGQLHVVFGTRWESCGHFHTFTVWGIWSAVLFD